MIRIFSAAVCPFAQRTRALLTHLGVEFELVEIDLQDKPDEFLEISPTGKVPLMESGDFVLFESQIINDYLVEKFEWSGAYPDQLEQKFRQKLAAKQWDGVVLEPFYAGLGDPARLEEAEGEIRDVLAFIEEVFQKSASDAENMISFHMATHWARMGWLSEYTDLPVWIEDYDALKQGLDRAVEQPAIQETLPKKEATVRIYEEHYVGEKAT